MNVHNVAHAHNGASFHCDRNEDLTHAATQMSPEGIMINEKASHEKAKYCMIVLYPVV